MSKFLQKIEAWFINKDKTYPICIENDGKQLAFELEGIRFSGSEFSDFSPENGISEKLLKEYDFFETKILGEKMPSFTLCNCIFKMNLPMVLFSTDLDSEINVVVKTQYYLGEARPKPKGGLVEDRIEMKVTIEEVEYQGKGDCFELAMDDFTKGFKGQYHMKNCYGCLFSDYSIYGQSSFGTMRCFKKEKEKYLKVKDKEEYSQIEKYAVVVQEIYCCTDFKKWVPGTGYRG